MPVVGAAALKNRPRSSGSSPTRSAFSNTASTTRSAATQPGARASLVKTRCLATSVTGGAATGFAAPMPFERHSADRTLRWPWGR